MKIFQIIVVFSILASIACDISSGKSINISELVIWKIIAIMFVVKG